MKRFRPRAIVSEQVAGTIDLGQQRAAWEMNRRNGRAQVAQITCDSWRDGAGTLWEPNKLALIDMAALKVTKQTWLIAQVVYRIDESGTHADVTLMPPAAFAPEPVGIPGDAQLFLDQQANAKQAVNNAAAKPDLTST